MTNQDLDRIEQELEIKLPVVYRQLMANYPLPACAGNSDTELWDNADKLIETNRKLHRGEYYGAKAWPAHLYCVGIDGTGSASAIDIRSPEAPTQWIDHCHADGPHNADEGPFEKWATNYLKNLRDDLEGDGFNPDGTPEAMRKLEAKQAHSGCVAMIVLIVVIVAIIVGVAVLVKWLR